MAADKGVETRNKQIVQAGFNAWRNGTGGVFDLLEKGAMWTIVGNSPVSRTYTGRQEFLDVVINPFNARLASRLVPMVRALYADGDMVIALFDAGLLAMANRTRIPTRGTNARGAARQYDCSATR